MAADRESSLDGFERWLASARAAWQEQGALLQRLTSAVLPALRADALAADLPHGQRVDLAAVEEMDMPGLGPGPGGPGRGGLAWVGPEGGGGGWGGDIDDWIGEQIAGGRRSRALYPVRALEAAPRVLWERAEA